MREEIRLDALSAQAQERIADGNGGMGIHSITASPTTVSNGSASQASGGNSKSISGANSTSKNNNTNSNINTNTNLTFQ